MLVVVVAGGGGGRGAHVCRDGGGGGRGGAEEVLKERNGRSYGTAGSRTKSSKFWLIISNIALVKLYVLWDRGCSTYGTVHAGTVSVNE